MAMAQAEAAQQNELSLVADNGQAALVPESNDFAHIAADIYKSTTSFLEMIGLKAPDASQSIASDIVNRKGSCDNVLQNLTDLKNQGKLQDFSTDFEKTYSVPLRDQLVSNYPGREADIDKALGTNAADKPDPMLGGLRRDQLQEVFKNFPALEGVIISPDVLGAIIQNEKDHTYNDGLVPDDSIIDGTLKAINWVRGLRGQSEVTEWMSNLKPDELREQADKSGNWFGFVDRIKAKIQERILRTSIGDGQVQIKNILALQEQERAAGRDVPTIASSLTPEGSANLVGAYFTKSIQMLNDGTITDPSKNPFWKNSPAVKKGFTEAQSMWNEGKRTGNSALIERAVMMTYNAGISNSDPEAWNPEHILKHYLGRK